MLDILKKLQGTSAIRILHPFLSKLEAVGADGKKLRANSSAHGTKITIAPFIDDASMGELYRQERVLIVFSVDRRAYEQAEAEMKREACSI